MAYSIKADLESITNLKIPINMITDSIALFDTITKATKTIEKHLIIDLKQLNSHIIN